mgnify:CR=1 FL=1
MDPLRFYKRDVEKKAFEFLAIHHSGGEIPVPIEDIVELKLGIRLIAIPRLEKDFGVNAFINKYFDSIVIDENVFMNQTERARFTISEEIGHLTLHKDWYQKNGPTSFDKYLDWQAGVDDKLFKYIEIQARTFASLILIPTRNLENEWKIIMKERAFTSPCDVFQLPDNVLPIMADRFQVTAESMLIRLSKAGWVTIPDGFWERKNKS